MANNRNMDAIMKWSVENTDPSAPSPQDIAADIQAGRRTDLNPAVLDQMMGKSEAQMMKEELGTAMSESRSEQDRATALDNFEMLIESIDNANLITSMKMWTPLLSLLDSSSADIQVATLWILGTAVQNNASAQHELLHTQSEGKQHPLDMILSLMRGHESAAVRAKALYALSALLGHYPKAVKMFEAKGGYEAIKGALNDPSVNIRRKAVFLINSLLLQDDSAAHASASQPLMIGGPPVSRAAGASVTELNPTPSRATAVTAAPNSSETTNSSARTGPAPLEKPPATSTEASGVVHPMVTDALIKSGLLRALLSSQLPAGSLPEDADAPPPELGPDGDALEARADEDYAEKALRATCSFVVKYQEHKAGAQVSLDTASKEALLKVREEVTDDPNASRLWDWRKLNLEESDWEAFSAGVDRLTSS